MSDQPRVDVQYEDQERPELGVVKLPVLVGIVANLTGDADPDGRARDFLDIDEKNLQKLAGLRPRYVGQVKDVTTGGELSVDATFDRPTEHWPALLTEQVPVLQHLTAIRRELEDLKVWIKTEDELRDALTALLGLPEDSRRKLVASFEAGPRV